MSLSNPSTGLLITAAAAYWLTTRVLTIGLKRRAADTALIPSRILQSIRGFLPLAAALGVAYWQGVQRSADLPAADPGAAVSVLGYVSQTIATEDQPARTVARLGDTTGKMLLRFGESSPADGSLVFAQGIVQETPSGGKYIEVKTYLGCPLPK